MASVNKIILIGRIGKDPEIRYTQKGDPIASFSLATSEKYKERESTQWHRIEVFGKTAEFVRDYASKGRLVYIEGKVEYEEWVDKEGNKRNTTKIKVGFDGKLNFLDRGSKESGSAADPKPTEKATYGADDDVPF